MTCFTCSHSAADHAGGSCMHSQTSFDRVTGFETTTRCECKRYAATAEEAVVLPSAQVAEAATTDAEAVVEGTVAEATERIAGITDSDLLRAAWDAENAGKNRSTLLEALTARIESLETPAEPPETV